MSLALLQAVVISLSRLEIPRLEFDWERILTAQRHTVQSSQLRCQRTLVLLFLQQRLAIFADTVRTTPRHVGTCYQSLGRFNLRLYWFATGGSASQMTTRLRTWTLVAWLLFLIPVAMIYIAIPPSPDQSQFDWMSLVATRGEPLYIGYFDMNWPGAIWLHEVGIRLFGVQPWTWRLTDFLLLSGFTIAGALFLSRAGWQLAPYIFLFLYPPLYVTAGGWLAGERDIIAAGLLLTACVLALPGGRREALAVMVAGACVAYAVLIRPTYLSFLAGLLILEVLPLYVSYPRTISRSRRALSLVIGFVLVIGCAIAAAIAVGNFDDWFEQSFTFSFAIYVAGPAQDWRETIWTLFVGSWHWVTLLAAVGAIGWVRRERTLSYSLALVLGIGATAALSFVVQDKGFGYHLGGVLPVIVLLASTAFESLSTARAGTESKLFKQTTNALFVGFALLAVAGVAKKLVSFSDGACLALTGQPWPADGYGLTEVERRRIVDLIETRSAPTDTVLVVGNQYELPYRANRLPTYRYMTPAADQLTRHFVNYDLWMAEIESGLTKKTPAFVIIQRQYLPPALGGPVSQKPLGPVYQRAIELVAEQYFSVFGNNRLVVYQKKLRNN